MRRIVLPGAVLFALLAFAPVASAAGWTIVQLPTSATAGTTLSSVSCPTQTFCAAVGGTGSAILQDGHWSIVPVAEPPDTLDLGLDSVSCTSGTSCFAVGDGCINPCTDGTTIVERWDGSTWVLVPAPNPDPDSELSSVSCSGPDACIAVGSYFFRQSMRAFSGTIAEQWDGTAWSADTVPASFPGGQVSCVSATDCTAGAGGGSSHWDGSAWSAVVPGSNLPAATINGLSCPSAGACQAVGGSSVPSEDDWAFGTFAESWDGMDWSQQATPDPGGGSNVLNAISCSSPTSCTAVGDLIDASVDFPIEVPLVETWDGTRWSAQPSPGPFGTLFGVSCTAGTACVAVGRSCGYGGYAADCEYAGVTGDEPLIEIYSGSVAAATVTPSPAAARQSTGSSPSPATTGVTGAVGPAGSGSAAAGIAVPVRCVGSRGRWCLVRVQLLARGAVVGSGSAVLRAGRRRVVAVTIDRAGRAARAADPGLRFRVSIRTSYRRGPQVRR